MVNDLTIEVTMCGNSDAKSPLPEWLTNSFLEDHLREHYKNDGIKVTNFEVKSPSGEVEGYTSSMLRTKINFIAPGDVSGEEKVCIFWKFQYF